MPIKSVTIEDIEALHARFPHTICLKRNNKPMPKGGERVESYDWVDMLYGPMATAVSDMSANKPVRGAAKTGSLVKLSLDEIVKRIGDDLILQDKYYNSCLQREQLSGVSGQEQGLREFYNEIDSTKFDPMYTRLSWMISSMSECGTIRPAGGIKPVDQKEIIDYVKRNIMSFRAYNVIKSMQVTGPSFEKWLESYIKCMVRGYTDNLADLEHINIAKLSGLQLKCARALAREHTLVEIVQPSGSDDYRTCLDDVAEYINHEMTILDTDVISLALTKLVLFELPSVFKESSWKDVLPWVMGLENTTTGMNFVDHVDNYPTSLSNFLLTLCDWRVKDEQLFESFYAQPVLFIKQDGELYAWSPAIERGERFVRVNYEFRKLREELRNYLAFDCTKITDFGWQDGQIYEGLPQEGYPCDINSHLRWLKLLRDSPCRVHHLDQFDRMQYLWKKVKTIPSPVTAEHRAFLNSLQCKVPSSSLRQEVVADIKASVTDKYQQLENYYSRLTRNGMGSCLAILSRLGIPVSEYWNGLLMDNAPIITSTIVTTIVALVFLSLVKMFKYGIEGEQQSKGEKRAKQKKMVPRKFNKLQLITGKQQSDSKMLERFDTADLGLNNLPDMSVIEDMFEHISECPNLGLVAFSYNKGTSENANFANVYAAFDEEYDFSYDTPQQPSWKKVKSYREDGERIIEFNLLGQGTEAEVMDTLSHMLETAKYYPAGAWTLESNFKLEDDRILYSIRLLLLNAKSRGGTVGWTRADVSKILDVQNMLNGGKIVDIDAVVTGMQQSASQAYDSLNAIVRNHMVKVECVKTSDVSNPVRLGRRVHALGSQRTLILPAHAVEGGFKWIRFSRVSDSKYVGLAIVERQPDYVRDIAVARIISRYEGEEILSNLDHGQQLRNISMQEFVFPDITKYLLSAEQAEVDWDGCSTLHYFANRRAVALGTTESFLLQSFQVPTLTESGEVMTMKERKSLCCKQALQSNFPLSELGDCGSPVILATGKRAGKLISFHTYYSPKTQQWFSAVITKEDLTVIKGLQQSFQDGWEQLIVPGEGVDLPHGPEVKYIGDLVRPSLPVTKSSLDHWHKSPFADQFEEQLAPGRLDPYDPYIETDLPVNKEGRKSLVLGPNSEMAKELPELDQNLLDWCKAQLIDEQVALFRSEQSLTKVSNDMDEMLDYALNGKPENKYVKGMEINKASGLPWSLNGTAKKSDFIELDEQTGIRSFRNDKNGRALQERIKQKLIQARKGYRMISFSSSKLKDQPIKIAQAKSGRTRVFHCIPVDLIMFQAALYGPYKEAYTRAGLKAYHAVGIDPKSVGWMELAAYMTKHPNYFDADYKNYDKYLHRQVYKCVRGIQREVIQRVCPDGWDAARAVEELDAIDTYVVDYRTIYQTNRANKSGSYTTTIDNCLANDIYGLYAWVKSTGVKSLYEYRANVSSVSFGDDIIKSVSDEYANKYNYCTYRDILNETGHVITPGSKDGEEKPFTSFENLQFLKRGFKMERGMVLAPLLKRSIEGPFVWTDIRTDQITIWINLVQEQLIEAALWGEEYYDEFRNKLKSGNDRRLNEALINLLNTSWEVTFQKFTERYYGA
uniref:RNA-dependent RNA polymerase n=1 Tax=Hangzhou nora-like virus 2 TaxID=2905605 RepID=A0A8K1XVX1_9VIRU|nr:MAG: RNA-dependent RNA polymerase [Hangzhou nora-like virus 2]